MKPIQFLKTGLLALALSAMIGCGSGSETAANTPAESGKTPAATNAGGKKIKIGISIPAADHGWTAGGTYWAEQEMKK